MIKKVSVFGYEMEVYQLKELESMLKSDILSRYNHEEYWDLNIIETFAQENNLKQKGE